MIRSDSSVLSCRMTNGPCFEVYRARDLTANQVVALQRLELRDDSLPRLSGFDILTGRRHPSIVGHYASFFHGSGMFIAAEYCVG
jgi:hypothetical protein